MEDPFSIWGIEWAHVYLSH